MSTSSNKQSFASRANLEYIEQLYTQFKQSPDQVQQEWRLFFEGVDFAQDGSLGLSEKELSVYKLIEAYRQHSHLEAQVNPLMTTPAHSTFFHLSKFNLKEEDLDKKFQIGSIIGKPNSTLREIVQHLKNCYCGKITVQLSDNFPDVCNWFYKEFENHIPTQKYSVDEKKQFLQSLTRAESLEKFIHTRYVGTKRFSIEGGDSLLPMLDQLANKCTQTGVEEIVIGMAHRGRINVLANFFGKNVGIMFADFNGPTETEEKIPDFDGDVKYHLGYRSKKTTPSGSCHISLAFNPSHLETVNPVVLGQARAYQRRLGDTKERKKVIPVLIHGDAAFAGQGVVLEILQMSQVRGYKVGGTIHIIVDNQVGFTTNPENARSANHSSDVGKVISTPVIHVNGDDTEACVKAMEIAYKYRQEFHRDVIVSLCCYRRFGHNEGDEPAYTQPLMYELIKKHPTPREIYAKQISREGSVDATWPEQVYNEQMDHLQKIYDETKKQSPKLPVFKFDGFWKGLRRATPEDFEKVTPTKTSLANLQKAGECIASYPSHFSPHPKLLKLLESRRNMAQGKEAIDWGMGEMLAYGTLLLDGHSVRITGQDCVRGTFTHRHAGLYDYKTGEQHMSLKTLAPGQEFCVYDSILSEYGVMGFEYGNSITDPSFLSVWEAQFGDFGNGAQIVIDQLLSAAESKWQQMSGLVLLLPHGYEGQGPEHSSARFERFLQLCAQNNMLVCNLTTPAQIFHALRRQVLRDFRKPLVVMSPKSLLRHPKAQSQLSDLTDGNFQEVIGDNKVKADQVENIILCTGKIYYELEDYREKQGKNNTAIVRVEQLYPFPHKWLAEELKKYKKAKNLIWCQEEPKNMGAYQFAFFQIMELLEKTGLNLKLQYAGRSEKASPATGSLYRHKAEQEHIWQEAFKN